MNLTVNELAGLVTYDLVRVSRLAPIFNTDDHSGYKGVGGMLYSHKTVKPSAKEYVNGMACTNGVESVWSTIKRGINGICHNWSKKHCQNYINEFMFRLNESNVFRDTQDRLDNLFKVMSGKPIMEEVE